MQKTSIEWTDYTTKPIYAVNKLTGKRGWFCDRPSVGCGHCYAANINKRFGTGLDFSPKNRDKIKFVWHEQEVAEVIKLNKRAQKLNQQFKVFPFDMCDLFQPAMPAVLIDRAFALFAICGNLTFQVLTKYAARMRDYLNNPATRFRIADEILLMVDDGEIFSLMEKSILNGFSPEDWEIKEKESGLKGRNWLKLFPLPNVWLLVSVENQPNADERIPLLLQTPAAVRGLSCEPLLGEIDLAQSWYIYSQTEAAPRFHWSSPDYPKIDWVIVGGESGTNARPAHINWFRSLRDQCDSAGVPFFFKQHGNWEAADSGHPRDGWQTIGYSGRLLPLFPSKSDGGEEPRAVVRRIGKKKAGRLLDGKTWDEYPRATAPQAEIEIIPNPSINQVEQFFTETI